MSRTFPFNVRDKLDDADWVHRRYLALAQIHAFTRAPDVGAHKQVS